MNPWLRSAGSLVAIQAAFRRWWSTRRTEIVLVVKRQPHTEASKTVKLSNLPILVGAGSVLLATVAEAHDRHAPLNSEQRVFMKQYELARAALAAGDLELAKKATAVVAALTVIHHESNGVDAPPGFVQDARKFVTATSLTEAREIFKSYSKRAVNVTSSPACSWSSAPRRLTTRRNGCNPRNP